jgi:uncharacterized protein
MPHVDSHAPGTINWVDFVGSDLDAASGFYTGLFGWETEDMPMPGGDGIYRFFRLDGRDAAAGGSLPEELRAQGIPSHWNVWVASDSAERTVQRAAAAGGQVLMPATTLGRRAPWPWSPTRVGPPSASGRPASTSAPAWSTSRAR